MAKVTVSFTYDDKELSPSAAIKVLGIYDKLGTLQAMEEKGFSWGRAIVKSGDEIELGPVMVNVFSKGGQCYGQDRDGKVWTLNDDHNRWVDPNK